MVQRRMKRMRAIFWLLVAAAVVLLNLQARGAERAPASDAGFTIRRILSAPMPSSLVAAPATPRIAWVFSCEGRRSIWGAEAPEFEARQITAFDRDDGQAVRLIGFQPDGRRLVFTRGCSYNPTHDPAGAPGWRLYAVDWKGGKPVELAKASSARNSPAANQTAIAEGGKVSLVSLRDGRSWRIASIRGEVSQLRWSPDGAKLAMQVRRTSTGERYSYIAVYDLAAKRLFYLDASIYEDASPRWSPDGTRVAFVRRLEAGPPSILRARQVPRPDPWTICVVEVESGAASTVLREPEKVSFPRAAIEWLSDDALVFQSERDGWLRLYWASASGGRVRELSPPRAEVEGFCADRVGAEVIFATNAGDADRRHLWAAGPRRRARPLTSGKSIQWGPVVTADGGYAAFFGSDARRPAQVFIRPLPDGAPRKLAAEALPADFPADQLVEPEPVVLRPGGGVAVHAQLFRPPGEFRGERPAVLFFHGGPMRQMWLGWHSSSYYHRAYAFNQYLASRGYYVLSVNYRLGIGYGRDFREAPLGGPRGAAEYQDLLAAARYLRNLPEVDPERIGLWGGSYGGYLTALALARNSDLFAAGVDLHGVHDWNQWQAWSRGEPLAHDEIAWKSSPVADLDSWRSPVLLVHGDDDRNVPFGETIRLIRELTRRGVHVEQLILPDEVHSFLRHESWVKALETASDFFDRKLRDKITRASRIREGEGRYEFNLDGTVLEVFTYKPKTYRRDKMIMVMHGTLRNADEYRNDAERMGERFGALIVAPCFDRERFPVRKYQYGGVLTADGRAAAPEDRTYAFIPKLAAAVRRVEKNPDLPFWIIGHSAGGQFVMRMAGFQDTGAQRLVAANPGSDLFPTRDLPFGYGFGGLPDRLSNDAAIRRYLAQPLTIYLGTGDNKPDRYFDQSETAMKQGGGRWQRGRACFEMGRKLAAERAWTFNWRLVEAEDVVHMHGDMFNHPRCADALFGQ